MRLVATLLGLLGFVVAWVHLPRREQDRGADVRHARLHAQGTTAAIAWAAENRADTLRAIGVGLGLVAGPPADSLTRADHRARA